MTTVVTIMDRDGFDQRTDNIVVVQPRRRRLLWVPRDVYCEPIADRINGAYKKGGHHTLIEALGHLGIPVDDSMCVPRAAVERALESAVVTVPVSEPIRLWYPLTPRSNMQEGRKPVDFMPPGEQLSGERIHQWLGARHGRDPGAVMTDLDRIGRQQVFVRALLRQGFDFSGIMADETPPAVSSPRAVADLERVRSWWRFTCADQVDDDLIGGKAVLRLRSPEPKSPRWRRAISRAVRLGLVPNAPTERFWRS